MSLFAIDTEMEKVLDVREDGPDQYLGANISETNTGEYSAKCMTDVLYQGWQGMVVSLVCVVAGYLCMSEQLQWTVNVDIKWGDGQGFGLQADSNSCDWQRASAK